MEICVSQSTINCLPKINFHSRLCELRTLLVELVQHFEFGPPEEGTVITNVGFGIALPAVKGLEYHGAQLPITIRPIYH
jgi:hypothetical protein